MRSSEVRRFPATRPVIARSAVGPGTVAPTRIEDRAAAWLAATAPLFGIALIVLTTSLMHV